jgi:hypothetical protein
MYLGSAYQVLFLDISFDVSYVISLFKLILTGSLRSLLSDFIYYMILFSFVVCGGCFWLTGGPSRPRQTKEFVIS